MSAIIKAAARHQMNVRVVISTAFECPYEGRMEPAKVSKLVRRLASDFGREQIKNIVIADTIGTASVGNTYALLDELLNKNDFCFDIGVHFHDTYGQALANILTSLSMNIQFIESSVGGLGGCPFANGATGNVATEDLIYMLNSMNIQSNVDLDKVMEASNFITQYLDKANIESKVTKAVNAKAMNN